MGVIYNFVRFALGIFFIIVGLNGFFQFIPLNYIRNQFDYFDRLPFFFTVFFSVQILTGVLCIVNKAMAFAALLNFFFLLNYIIAHIIFLYFDVLSLEMIFFHILFFLNLILLISKRNNIITLFK